jgi:pSer/pThr/pTyr-binding forkhead associated (FHA) protein
MQIKLVLFKPNGRRRDFDLTAPKTSIGRRDDCTLRIPLMGVSRKHCELTVSERSVRVKDLGSSNGTFVNGRKVTDQPLKAGDKLTVGAINFTVQIDGKPSDLKPPKAPAKAPLGDDLVTDLSGEDDLEITELGGSEDTSGAISALEALASEDDEKQK